MTATADAFYNLYKTLPREVKEEVRTLISTETGEDVVQEIASQKWAKIESYFAPLRRGLPGNYRFNREEANER
ncbi:MAG: hypothetical protein LH606_05510 [Cytophagaceae bacterium]|nr:hypothetical protein [Cytophagaceae bacterium]